MSSCVSHGRVGRHCRHDAQSRFRAGEIVRSETVVVGLACVCVSLIHFNLANKSGSRHAQPPARRSMHVVHVEAKWPWMGHTGPSSRLFLPLLYFRRAKFKKEADWEANMQLARCTVHKASGKRASVPIVTMNLRRRVCPRPSIGRSAKHSKQKVKGKELVHRRLLICNSTKSARARGGPMELRWPNAQG